MLQIYNQPYLRVSTRRVNIYAKNKEEVVSILKQHGEAAKIVGAGITLHEMAVLGFLPHVKKLIDLRNLGLDYVKIDGAQIKVGASTKLRDMASNDFFRKETALQTVGEAVDSIPLQVANAATLGGNLCSAVPIVSMPPVLMSLDTQLVLTGSGGDRVIPLEMFYEDYLLTNLRPDEFLSENQDSNETGEASLNLSRRKSSSSRLSNHQRIRFDIIEQGFEVRRSPSCRRLSR